MSLSFESLSILVVEDTLPMRKLIVSVLESLKFGAIYTAEDGHKGLEVARAKKPDLILTDWLMKPMDGLEMVRHIRNNAKFPNRHVPIILITGYSAIPRVMEARDSGVTEFLVKPFTANDLAKRISHVINKPRDFVDCGHFYGPDRRRKKENNYTGPKRREADRVIANSRWEIDE